MTSALVTVAYVIGYAAIVLCLVIVAGKVVWNIGVPYAMLREHRRGLRRGWSIFPAIEILPLLVAIGISFLVSGRGLLSPRVLALWGSAAVVVSYAHFGLVAIGYWGVHWLMGQRHSKL